MKIIDRYLVKEFLPPFFLGILLFTFVLLINRIFKLTELVVNKGVSILDVLRLISYVMPSFLTLTIPMSVLLASLVVFGRLSTDSEVIALKATGFSLYRLIAPVLVMASLAMLATSYFSLYLGPLKARSFKKDLFMMAKSSTSVSVQEGMFNDSFRNVVIYAMRTPSPNEMEGVFISDERNPSEPYVIIAKKGALDMDLSTGYAYLNLYEGSIHKKGSRPGSYQHINFDTNTFSINLYEKFFSEDDVKKGRREMTLTELRDMARTVKSAGESDYPLLTEYYKRFTIPLACIIFGFIGPPLGLYSRRSGRSAGLGVALAIFALYYILMKGGENLSAEGRLTPIVAALIPNVIIGGAGLFILISSAREKSPLPLGWLYRLRRGRRLRRRRAGRRTGGGEGA